MKSTTDTNTYDPSWYSSLRAIEEQHFWFRARNDAIKAVMKQVVVGFPDDHFALEAGCGTGNVLRELEKLTTNGTVVGLDRYIQGLHIAQKRTAAPLVQGDIHIPPFKAVFDLIGFFDVLEHLPDDMQVLRSILSLLKPGGKLLLTVPAHQYLWSYFDESSQHQRRYELDELRQRLNKVGFQIDYLTEYMASVWPLAVIRRRLMRYFTENKKHESGLDDMAIQEIRVIPVFNNILYFLLSQENRLIANRLRIPIGSSILAVANRPL